MRSEQFHSFAWLAMLFVCVCVVGNLCLNSAPLANEPVRYPTPPPPCDARDADLTDADPEFEFVPAAEAWISALIFMAPWLTNISADSVPA